VVGHYVFTGLACLCLVLAFCLFFFSSRRRHTRFSRDWSSDVCSSDLAANDNTLKVGLIGCGGRGTGAAVQALKGDSQAILTCMRSEERRVGKECRARWSP